ncbi:MAG: methionine--tRNA ligase [Gammaproteobacteria bacterium]|nr:methionine--tRNA ligase [Gammaproteobacteria bacterium]MYD02230.1 methionine--tRNA ligase [Gammaproteobacteria bacterium]MYI25083.1 methionine--tRNA ligase [Gammaproteobacteria bacterium]
MARKILVTAALPYASGQIHLGNLLEMVQTDIWVRYQRLSGADCAFVCATDAHGTPTMLKAREEGTSPEKYAESCRAAHVRDFESFGIRFDNYYTTHSPENRELVERIYSRLVERGYIRTRTIQQAYDEEAGMFLPDRYVRGECPSCGAEDQYGDSCAACGATYAPSELVNPRSILSGRPPVTRESEHKFFKLGEFESLLKTWMQAGNLDRGARNKLAEWFKEGLKDWDITRDEPYFGFEVPGEKGKYFYVWLDAPVGYMASFRNLCGAGEDAEDRFERYFGPDSDAELYHFIGKDILYFHALFWPAVLLGAGMRTPSGVFVHGFLTVDGLKMSKSKGTFITASDYLAAGLDPEYLRYYYAAKLGPGLDDIDLQLEDFAARINSDLVGKLVNIASRCASFVQRGFDNRLGPRLHDPALYEEFAAQRERIGEHYESRSYGKAMRAIMALADRANVWINERKPWELAKDPDRQDELQAIVTQGINLFRVLMTYIAPVLPDISSKAGAFLRSDLKWNDVDEPLLGESIAVFKPLAGRISLKTLKALVETNRGQAAAEVEHSEPIDIEEFLRTDLRVAKIVKSERVAGANRLLRLTLDDGGKGRTVFAGIAGAYAPSILVGRKVVLVANLKPRKMRFGVSEGMVLAAGEGESRVFLLSPDEGAEPGMRVR